MLKVDRFLAKISKKDREKLLHVLIFIQKGRLSGLDLKKLKGQEQTYRVRVGSYRITFEITESTTTILEIQRRGDHTYN